MENLIETHHLNFSFKRNSIWEQILHNVSIQVPEGSIYCFLGPNGAGKTTTLRIILGLIRLNNERITLFGENLLANRTSILRRIGSLIEQPSLYQHLTGRENLEIYRLTYGINKSMIEHVLQLTGLTHVANQVVHTYSLGMKQRLAIALALLHDPQLLILDEPTNGLDPEGIIEARNLILRLNKEFGKTILVSSHLLSEVEKIATHVGILAKGRLLFQDTNEQLHQLTARASVLEVEVDDAVRAETVLKTQVPVNRVNNGLIQITSVERGGIPHLVERLVNNNIQVYKVGPKEKNLEELFIEIVSK